jgi:hypothetical protein
VPLAAVCHASYYVKDVWTGAGKFTCCWCNTRLNLRTLGNLRAVCTLEKRDLVV